MTVIDAVPVAAASGDDLIPLVNWVKASEAPYIQAQIANLLSEPAVGDGSAYRPPYSNTYGPSNAWDLPKWKPGEEAAAAWILSVLGDNQRKVVGRLVAAGTEGVWTGELRRIAGYDDSTSMSGVFKAIGGRFRATGHRPVWNGGTKAPQKGQKLTVLEETARALFTSVITSSYPDVAQEFGIG